MSLFAENAQMNSQFGPPLDALAEEVRLHLFGIVFVRDGRVFQVSRTGERGDVGVSVGAFDGDVEQFAGEDVAGAVKTTWKLF